MSSLPLDGRRRTALLLVAGIGVLGLMLLAFWPDRALPEGPPSITGTITALGGPPGGDTATILVEENPKDVSGSAKDQVTITRATRLYREDGAALQPATIADLAIGKVVRVWHTGPVAESYPRQATAGVLVITPGGP